MTAAPEQHCSWAGVQCGEINAKQATCVTQLVWQSAHYFGAHNFGATVHAGHPCLVSWGIWFNCLLQPLSGPCSSRGLNTVAALSLFVCPCGLSLPISPAVGEAWSICAVPNCTACKLIEGGSIIISFVPTVAGCACDVAHAWQLAISDGVCSCAYLVAVLSSLVIGGYVQL